MAQKSKMKKSGGKGGKQGGAKGETTREAPEVKAVAEPLYIVIAPPRHVAPPFVVRKSPEAQIAILERKMSGPDIAELHKRAAAKAVIAEAALMGALREAVVQIGTIPQLGKDEQAWAIFTVGVRRKHAFRIERDPSKHYPREYVIYPHDPDDGQQGPGAGGGFGPNGAGGPVSPARGKKRDSGGSGGGGRRRNSGKASRAALSLYNLIMLYMPLWISAARVEFPTRSRDSVPQLGRAAGHVVRIVNSISATVADMAEDYLRKMRSLKSAFTSGAQSAEDRFGSGAMLKARLVGESFGLPLLLFSFVRDEAIDWNAYLFGVDWSQNIFGDRAEEGPMAA